jgi:hypothetical protein
MMSNRSLFRLLGASLAAAGVFASAPAQARGGCDLGDDAGGIQHVIYVQFDNTHLRRDRDLVPSDLEQMPHLLNFIQDNGTMLSNDHTVLISHPAGGILSSLTGVYPDRHGQIVSNSNVRITSTGGFQFPSSFGYWTDPVAATTTIPNMVGWMGRTFRRRGFRSLVPAATWGPSPPPTSCWRTRAPVQAAT